MSIQLSPDHKWIWDGTRWLPISPVPPAPGAQAAVATYSPPRAAAPEVAMPHPHVPEATGPTFDVPVVPPAVTPLWEQPTRSGATMYLYVVAGAVVLVMAMIVLNSMNIVRLPWQSDGSTPSVPTATPLPPVTARTDYARADRFLNLVLAPAMVSAGQTVPAMQTACNGTLSNSCLSSITATDQQMKKVLSVIDGGEVPPCIGVGVNKLRIDLAGMESGLTLALSGFQQNQRNLVAAGLSRFGSLSQALPADATSVNQAMKAQCNTQEVGP
ncbi:MAG TPA: hypothetical protein VHJ99_09015 [Candidatus Dormibacteraeota bacterium]|nr:hypothetical protein [Candidatus Dormibacteraeota bacterium]